MRSGGDDDRTAVEAAAPAGTIAGSVLLPPGVSASGLEVFLDDMRAAAKTTTDAGGRFRVADVAAGEHTLFLGGRPGELAKGASAAVAVVSGGSQGAVIDAREQGMCQVTLTVLLEDAPAAGMQVTLVAVENPHETAQLGQCDEEGRVSGSVRGWGAARVRIWRQGTWPLQYAGEALDLRGGEAMGRTLRFRPARLRLTLPRTLVLPEEGRIQLDFDPAGADLPLQGAATAIAEEAPVEGDTVKREGDALVFDLLDPGTCALTVRVLDASSEGAYSRFLAVDALGVHPPLYESTVPVTLVAGPTVDVTLP